MLTRGACAPVCLFACASVCTGWCVPSAPVTDPWSAACSSYDTMTDMVALAGFSKVCPPWPFAVPFWHGRGMQKQVLWFLGKVLRSCSWSLRHPWCCRRCLAARMRVGRAQSPCAAHATSAPGASLSGASHWHLRNVGYCFVVSLLVVAVLAAEAGHGEVQCRVTGGRCVQRAGKSVHQPSPWSTGCQQFRLRS